jgi:vancomycin resistance protein VanJ
VRTLFSAGTRIFSSRPKAGDKLWLTRSRRIVLLCCWLFGLLLLTLWLIVRSAGDNWWPATVFIYSPRWPWLVVWTILTAASAAFRPRLLLLQGVNLLLLVFPIMGLCLGWPSAAPASAPSVRLLTCNLHRRQLDASALGRFLDDTQPDIVVLQDWSDAHKGKLFEHDTWHLHRDDELLLASRYPVEMLEDLGARFWPGRGGVVHYGVQTPMGLVHVINVHLASPHESLAAIFERIPGASQQLEANSAERLVESTVTSAFMKQIEGPVLVAGDFNTPPNSRIYAETWSEFPNAFASTSLGFGYTYHTRWTSLRIDHILAGPGWHFQRCWIGPFVGSPHRPLVADIDWTGASVPRASLETP